jgi:DNA-binding IclR family transcriptional regulator
MSGGDRDRAEIRSVGRALDLLEIMQSAAPAGVRVCEAADHLGVDPATASRLLSTLMAHGYASRMSNRRYLLQLVGTEAVTLARLAGNRRAKIDVEDGPSYPLWATAAGRALLASVPPVRRPALLPDEPFPAFTPHTKTTWDELAAMLREARSGGIYVEEGEFDPHLSCYAMPLLHRNRDEKLAVAVSFESARSERDRRFICQALHKEWREFEWQI